MTDNARTPRVGWIGTGRMGTAMVRRLLAAGHEVAVYNRTRAKAERLAEHGAVVVDSIADLADLDVVFTMVSASEDVAEVTIGPAGVLADAGRQAEPDGRAGPEKHGGSDGAGESNGQGGPEGEGGSEGQGGSGEPGEDSGGSRPRAVVDMSTVSAEVSARIRRVAEARGVAFFAAPVSGNPSVVASGRLAIVVSGPEPALPAVRELLTAIGPAVTYVGDGDVARQIKIAHNLFLASVTQALAEVTVLAERAGVPRREFLDFINNSVVGSPFTRYKSPAFVSLDLTPTFTCELLRKDLDLGLDAGAELGVPMPSTELTRGRLVEAIEQGHGQEDFAALLLEAARAAGLDLAPETSDVSDGLH